MNQNAETKIACDIYHVYRSYKIYGIPNIMFGEICSTLVVRAIKSALQTFTKLGHIPTEIVIKSAKFLQATGSIGQPVRFQLLIG